MNTGMGVRLKRIAKVLGTIIAIELCLPGGTLLALGYLLALQCHGDRSAAGEPALPTWRDLRGLLAGHPAGGLAPGASALQTPDGVKKLT
jgi:hypothetical protein